jgi:tRNA modification GTPase
MPLSGDTIFALSSGRPPAAIAVVRLSGPRAGAALEKLAGRVPEPRKAALVRVRDPGNREVIDEALALWFPGPNSETGEDVAELQLHGGRAVIAAVLGALGQIEGLRPAEAGEFTRRAFENGRLDLTAVEGLADLIYAETEAQRRQAYRQLKGLLGERAETWRQRLIEALALVEARIDFSDEADVPEDLLAPALAIARGLRDEIAEALAGAARGERLRDGLVVAIAGPPNAGKSTLLNRIARREAAIVSPVAGTTRDVIEVHLDLEGYPVTLLDTAGISDSADPVEQEGVRRARQRASEADLVVWVEDARAPPEHGGSPPLGAPATTWRVQNKIDLLRPKDKNDNRIDRLSSTVFIFRRYGEALAGLSTLLPPGQDFFGAEPSMVSRQRHRRALKRPLALDERWRRARADARISSPRNCDWPQPL